MSLYDSCGRLKQIEFLRNPGDVARLRFRNLEVGSKEQRHPVQSGLALKACNQDSVRLMMAGQVFGSHFPMKMLLERKIAMQAMRPYVPGMAPPDSTALDTLMGKGDTIEFDDFLNQAEFHTVEHRMQPGAVNSSMEDQYDTKI